jgi:hypothetical protein
MAQLLNPIKLHVCRANGFANPDAREQCAGLPALRALRRTMPRIVAQRFQRSAPTAVVGRCPSDDLGWFGHLTLGRQIALLGRASPSTPFGIFKECPHPASTTNGLLMVFERGRAGGWIALPSLELALLALLGIPVRALRSHEGSPQRHRARTIGFAGCSWLAIRRELDLS